MLKKKKFILPKEIDVKGGKFTYGQRIELGKIFQNDELSEVDKFERTFECLHGFKPLVFQYKKLMPYFEKIVEGFTFWIQTEVAALNYEPTAEEISAGIKDLSQKLGEFGTSKAIAKAFGKDPDEILKWEYAKVFGILYTDLEEAKFQMKYQKILTDKYKIKK